MCHPVKCFSITILKPLEGNIVQRYSQMKKDLILKPY